MSGGLFDQSLFDAPLDAPGNRGGAGKRRQAAAQPGDTHPTGVGNVSVIQKSDADGSVKTPDAATAADNPAAHVHPPRGKSPAAAAGPIPVQSVSEVNGLIGRVLQAQLPGVLRVRGEISNFNVYSKGHAFFKLKDQRSELPCMMWRNDLEKLRFTAADGLAVIAEGEVKLYEAQGRLQLYVHSMIPQGAGELELAFRQLCDKLRAEGLFDPARKRPIPAVPLRVVVITSPTGDVFHDVVTTARRRFANIHIMLFPVPVQGASAAAEIARAIDLVNAHAAAIGGVDVMMLVRGGGSLEDLWAFNEEVVARAIVRSTIPVATGIGHEPDVTIADLVADLRGPTPTGAAAMIIAEKAVLQQRIAGRADALGRELTLRCRDAAHTISRRQAELTETIGRVVRSAWKKTESAERQVAGIEPRHAVAQGWRRLENGTQSLRRNAAERLRVAQIQLAENATRLGQHGPQGLCTEYQVGLSALHAQLLSAMGHQRQMTRQRLADLEKQLELAGPMQVLQRGFTITTDVRGGVIKAASQAQLGQKITTRTADGTFDSVVS